MRAQLVAAEGSSDEADGMGETLLLCGVNLMASLSGDREAAAFLAWRTLLCISRERLVLWLSRPVSHERRWDLMKFIPGTRQLLECLVLVW